VTKKSKHASPREWAVRITALRERLGINQAELARKMECSAMTVSRWERGLLSPSADYFIQLGNLGNKNEAWFFWERAGIQAAKMVGALEEASKSASSLRLPRLEPAHAGAKAADQAERLPEVVALPLLKAIAGTHGQSGDKRSSLRTIPATQMMGAPGDWCPNPAYTSLLRVKGHSMEPLIRNGDIMAVDSFQIDRSDLYGKIVIVASEEKGLCVSRLQRYKTVDVLESENRQYEPVVFGRASGWRIMGRVLWWISAAP
jgi:phage repressor protein C with HTH and peptisase S24 domain